jgi:GRIP domain
VSSELEGARERVAGLEREGRGQADALQARVRELTHEVRVLREAEGGDDEFAALQRTIARERASAEAAGAELERARGDLEAARAQAVQALWDRERAGGAGGEPRHARTQSSAPDSVAAEQSVASTLGGASASAGIAAGHGTTAAGASGGSAAYWRERCEAAQGRVAALEADIVAIQRALGDERHAHELRSLADSARRDEIAELQARTGRSSVDVEYLKNALLGFFESGELRGGAQVLLVLERLLCFSEKDRERVGTLLKGARAPRTPRKGSFG